MEGFELTAIFAGEQRFPKRFEGRSACTEELAEFAAVATVYQPDQVGWGEVGV